ncbi:reverse transcriptase domain-containing protein [Tanacetum coccineum]
MSLELANRSITYPVSIAEDVFVQVDKFTFPCDFVVVDYDVNPRVPLILGRPFLRMARALVDVHREELTLRVKINSSFEWQPTPSDPVVASLSLSLTSFGDSDFLLEDNDTFLALDDSIPPKIDNGIYDSEGDILFLENLLNDDPTKDLPPKELKNDETKTTKSSIKEPPQLELKDLPPLPRVFFDLQRDTNEYSSNPKNQKKNAYQRWQWLANLPWCIDLVNDAWHQIKGYSLIGFDCVGMNQDRRDEIKERGAS